MSNFRYSYSTRNKLQKFLDDKIREILYGKYNSIGDDQWSEVINELKTKRFLGHKVELFKENYWKIFINIDCYVYCYSKKKRKMWVVGFTVNNISSSGYFSSPAVLKNSVIQLPKIIEEFEQLCAELEKREKIIEITQKSILTWLETIMPNSGYEYYTTNENSKVVLSVRMKRGVQLDIPIYFTKFQKIMPKLLETIKNYEKTVKENTVKILIRNLNRTETWKK